MFKLHGYYDRDRNPMGKGIEHQYVVKKINADTVVVIDEATELMWQHGGSSNALSLEDAKNW